MEIIVYIIAAILLALNVFLILKAREIENKLNTQTRDQKKQLADAGNAITDTLRVIFENLKVQSSKIDKMNKKETEYQSRFHKIENDVRRIILNDEKRVELKNIGEKKYERNNDKAS